MRNRSPSPTGANLSPHSRTDDLGKTYLPKKPGVFYGYWVIVVTFFCVFIFSGCGFYAFSLFIKSLQAEFGWGRSYVMAALTIFYLIIGISAPSVGKLISRYGAREVISIGASIAGIGFILLSLMNNLWHFYVSYAVVAVGMVAIGPVPTTVVVSNWFKKRRGMAIGVMSTGVGAGGFALAPLIGGYLIPNFGWKVAYLALALFVWILIPLALLVVRTKPADMGLYPDGMQAPEVTVDAKTLPPPAEGMTLKMALATSGFWLIAVSFLTSTFSQVGITQSQVPYLEDIGFPVIVAATALGGVGLGSIIGKFGFGWLCDRIQAKYACFIGLSFQVAGIIMLMSVKPASPTAIIWLYAIVMGLGLGSWLPTSSMLVSTNFGLSSYSVIFGMITLAQSIGIATGPLIAGYMYDIMGTYHWAFIIFLALYAVAIPTILAVRRTKSL